MHHLTSRLIVTAAVVSAISVAAAVSRPASAPERVIAAEQPAADGATISATETPRPRRIILVIGDGMGFNQVTAGSMYRYGAAGRSAFERFPVRRAVSTFSAGGGYDPALAWKTFGWVLANPTDSAAAATAMATGSKTYNAAIGVDEAGQPLVNLVEDAEASGRSTGLVTSVPISHATPGGFGAHETDRDAYSAIARDLLSRSALDVLMGAGHPLYDNAGRSAAADYRYVGGSTYWSALRGGRLGGDADADGDVDRWTLVDSKTRFAEMMNGSRIPRRVMGLARVRETLQQRRPGSTSVPFGAPRNAGVPSLSAMSRAALYALDRDSDGFFLMVEGGAIDWANHSNQKGRLLEEQRGLEDAVKVISAWVDTHGGWEDTLLIVTADHESGYLTGPSSGQTAAGPVWRPLVSRGVGGVPGMRFNTTKHTNSLVPLYARGAGADGLGAAATRDDSVHGAYLDNTDVHDVLQGFLR